ncbi:acetylxylan esterase [Cyclobacterium amurskyense]|uniref:Acetyl xylan esterase n=1 Tax=Cyclobacterium amurskyense TaxID=320787 RepID=A0A0H4PLY4_9BACT|nr:acetylxylan esterase [Cyclobacterium amurskyense]AKP54040.1 Acetyl xylan esterase [Cyclobacterium amurskyense]|tara:strand:+ start:447 stop:1730 length:1284 start_codon:yes stop_codon:yes gene_type:complete
MKNCYPLLLFVGLIFSQLALGQSQQGQLIRIMVSPSKADMIYQKGDNISFDVAVYKFGQLVEGAEIEYEIGPEKMEPVLTGNSTLKKGTTTLKGGKLSVPGFIRCKVTYKENGKTYSNTGTAGIAPLDIQPTTTLPKDFEEFWEEGKNALKGIPLEPVLTLIPERSTHHTNVYHVSFSNISGKIYGILTKPKKPGKYPAILHVPGAGIRPYYGANINQDVIALQIGIHGIPVDQYESSLYKDLGAGALSNYNRIFLDDKDKYYYKRVYLGCVRAVDFIFAQEEFDGENIGVMGGSQGGALSIITAGLDDRIKYLVSYYPALSDLTGYLHGRAGGWPHLFRDEWSNKAEKIETSKYYDVVNFARFVKVPGFYSWGFNDNVCPPTSMYSAFNVVPGKKELSLYHDASHWRYAEQSEEGHNWLVQKIGTK